MTGSGEKLVGVDPEQLRQQLRTETDAKATKQLTVALLYDAGFSPYIIEDLLGFPAQTAYGWLDTVAERGDIALGDAPRSGRPSYLAPEQWDQLTATLQAPPSETGVDAPAWKPPLAREYIVENFGAPRYRRKLKALQQARSEDPATE